FRECDCACDRKESCGLRCSHRGKFNGNESVHALQDLTRRTRRGHLLPELGAVANAMRKPARELLHFPNRVRPPRITQMAEISREQIVAIAIRGLRIAPRSNKLFDLAADPGIRAGSAPNHYGVAACLAHHTPGI